VRAPFSKDPLVFPAKLDFGRLAKKIVDGVRGAGQSLGYSFLALFSHKPTVHLFSVFIPFWKREGGLNPHNQGYEPRRVTSPSRSLFSLYV